MKRISIIFLAGFAMLLSVAQAQPIAVTNIPQGSTRFTTIGDYVYFISRDALWRTDGTAEGTIQLRTGFDGFGVFRAFNGELYFLTKFVDAAWTELWKSDGTPNGTIMLQNASAIVLMADAGDYLYFAARDASTGLELHRTDGTPAGTIFLKDINPGSADGIAYSTMWIPSQRPTTSGGVGHELLFAADNGTAGNELWKSDGTPAGTVMVKDINPGSGDGFEPAAPVVFNNRFYFRGSDPLNGSELWASDGTSSGTALVKDVMPGVDDSYLEFIPEFDQTLYFLSFSYDRSTLDLWKTDGTSASTQVVKALCGACELDTLTMLYNNQLFFFLTQGGITNKLWGTNGTAEGTSELFSKLLDGSIPFFEEVNDYMIFYTTSQGHNMDLYRSEGTGAEPFWRFKSAGLMTYPISMAKLDDLVYFSDHDGPDDGYGNAVDEDDSFQLMQTDGLTVRSLRSIFGKSFSNTSNITNYLGRLVFTTGSQLWIYDPVEMPEEAPTFTIVNADTDEDIREISEGDVFVKPANTKITIRYNAAGAPASVVFEHENDIVRRENAAPFSISGDRSGDYMPWPAATAGRHRVEATPYSESNGQGTAGETLTVHFTIVEETPTFTLVNADTEEDIQVLQEGDVFVKPAGMNINIRYNPVGVTPGSVVFEHQNDVVRRENAAPFALAGDRRGDYITWTGAGAGNHRVEATPYSDANGSGMAGETLVVHFTIQEAGDACTASGAITCEFWSGVSGNRVSDIPVNSPPSSTAELTIFEGPDNVGTNYGARIRGYICPPATGSYTFWIASNDHSELWLSTDDDPANKTRIAYLDRATGPREWNRFASQSSASIWLAQGQTYYIEALHKQGIGADHVAVGWQLPDGTLERPIDGNRLSPFEMDAAMMVVNDENQAQDKTGSISAIDIYPNPARSGSSALTISGYDGFDEIIETRIMIRNMTGDVVFSDRISCGGNCSSYLMKVDEQLSPGLYFVEMKTNDVRHSRRLLVR